MRKLIGKVAFCLMFIFIIGLAILEHEATQVVSSQVVLNEMEIQYISSEEANEMKQQNKKVILIDVRTNREFIQSHLQDAINAPANEINEYLVELNQFKESTIIIYCESGIRSGQVAQQLDSLGFKNIYVIKGGIH